MPSNYPTCPVCAEPADHILRKKAHPHERWNQLLFLTNEGIELVTSMSAPGTRCFVCDVLSRTGKLNEVTFGKGKKRLLGSDCLKHLNVLANHYAHHPRT